MPPIQKLGDLVFVTLLQNRATLNKCTKTQNFVVSQYRLRHETPQFLQCIANGDQVGAQALLKKNPALAVAACGDVTTYSQDTIKNVTAFQLAYILEDNDMLEMMLPYLDKCQDGKAIVFQQLEKIMSAVDQQELQYQPFDYTNLVSAISRDENLEKGEEANSETMQAFTEFKESLGPVTVTMLKPFNMNHFRDGYNVHDENPLKWSTIKGSWFSDHVIRYLQSRVSASYAQFFSQGLINRYSQDLQRSFALKCSENQNPISYYDVSKATNFQLYVDIYFGAAVVDGYSDIGGATSLVSTINHLQQDKARSLKNFVKKLQPHPPRSCVVL